MLSSEGSALLAQSLNHLSPPLPPSASGFGVTASEAPQPSLAILGSGFGVTASEAPQHPLAVLGSGFGVTASMTLEHCLFTSHLVNNFILNYSCLAAGTVFAS